MVLVDTERFKAIEHLILVCRAHVEHECAWWTVIQDALARVDATEKAKP